MSIQYILYTKATKKTRKYIGFSLEEVKSGCRSIINLMTSACY